MLKSIALTNFLSYGPKGDAIPLRPLNVLIGPNGSGKSNLLEAIGVLKALPNDLTVPFRSGGGISQWLWKGTHTWELGAIDAVVLPEELPFALRQRLRFGTLGSKLMIFEEVIENEEVLSHEVSQPYYSYHNGKGDPILNYRGIPAAEDAPNSRTSERRLRHENLSFDQSVLSQRKDPDSLPELFHLGGFYSRIHTYQPWQFGRQSPARLPQQTDLPSDFLQQDAGNLAIVLNNLLSQPEVEDSIQKRLGLLSEGAKKLRFVIQGGTVQLFLEEEPNRVISAMRLSDGTLRFLCLLAILCHPNPPPLITIEDPDQGLHPDLMRTLAELLVEASERTQLVVTTHSDHLVTALADHSPESVIVCEKYEDGTELRRLDADRLAKWLESYKLGELWLNGEIGGTRW